MEAQANFGLSYENLENFRAPQSLTQYRQGLSDSEVLFSFHLGTRQSFLWEATRDSLDAYRLPARDQIRSRFKAFARPLNRVMNRSVPILKEKPRSERRNCTQCRSGKCVNPFGCCHFRDRPGRPAEGVGHGCQPERGGRPSHLAKVAAARLRCAAVNY